MHMAERICGGGCAIGEQHTLFMKEEGKDYFCFLRREM